MFLRVSLFSLLALAVSCLAWADDSEPEPPLKTKHYKSPQAVFDASMAASLKKDHVTVVDCIAPSAHKEMAGTLAYSMLMLKQSKAKLGFDDKQFKPGFDAMDKHGLTEKATKDIKIDDQKEAVKAVTKLIKKPTAFTIDMMKAQYEIMKAFGVTDDQLKQMKYELKDLKIDGDKAKGTASMTSLGGEHKQPMEFVKVRGGGWKILPDLTAGAMIGGAGPAPPPPPPPILKK